MPVRLEISLKPELFDAEGESIKKKAKDYFRFQLNSIRTVHVITIDASLSSEQLEEARVKIFTNPVTQLSSFQPLIFDFYWAIWVGYLPGVKDPAGSTAVEAIEDLLKVEFKKEEAVYTSKLYFLKGGNLSRSDVNRLTRELLANDLIQQWRILSEAEWDRKEGIGLNLPRVILEHEPSVIPIPVESDVKLRRISDQRNLALNPHDIPTIREYFLRETIQKERAEVGLSLPTDVELEYIAQARSDHCNHNTFKGLFRYRDLATGEERLIDNLFKRCIEEPTLKIKKKKPWVISVLWDNAGVGRFDEHYFYTITGETHNSPSNVEAYGGAITGIVGVYRDPMGTGKGSKLILGTYGYCVGPRDYNGYLKPHLHPRRLLDGVIEGVKDGGNKSGIPTPFGKVFFDESFMGKCLVLVTTMGIMPSTIKGKPADKKTTHAGDLLIMTGGKVGKDGIHGVTAASEVYTEHTPAGHVQIGDPYTQKKMHDFLLEVRDEGLIEFITDNGGGGLSSSVGESARFSNGCEVHLEKVPLKYEGLDQWEIWVSESQERMTVAIKPANRARFFELSRKHDVKSTVIGKYTDTGKLHLKYKGKTCAYVNMDFLQSEFPQWEFDAEWIPPQLRSLQEPVLKEVADHNRLLLDMLSRPNICSKEWIVRQYDHEVQGGSVIKPLVGRDRDVNSDAVVVRPVLESTRGIAITQAVNPTYSKIDSYHMTAYTIDEAVRRLIAVGGDPDHIGGVDNFCWPNIQYDAQKNPDGKLKAAQLVRAGLALRECCLAFGIPLLSGKDSMYIDGELEGEYGERHKLSGLPTIQFTATGVIQDVRECVTMEAKIPGDLVYILGVTKDELGGSEYYDRFGYTGLNVPQVKPEEVFPLYKALHRAINEGIVASAHGIYRGGLGVHLALVSMGGGLGMKIDLSKIPVEKLQSDDKILYSESAGRFIVTIAPKNKERFEKILEGSPHACVGRIILEKELIINGLQKGEIIRISIGELKEVWQKPFGDLI